MIADNQLPSDVWPGLFSEPVLGTGEKNELIDSEAINIFLCFLTQPEIIPITTNAYQEATVP